MSVRRCRLAPASSVGTLPSAARTALVRPLIGQELAIVCCDPTTIRTEGGADVDTVARPKKAESSTR